MKVPVSKAEFQVFNELSKRNLTIGMETQRQITLKVVNNEVEKEVPTTPDFWWIYKHKMVYLDGDAVHEIGSEWDEQVVKSLEVMRFKVRRIRYHAPLTEQRKLEIVDDIQEFIKE